MSTDGFPIPNDAVSSGSAPSSAPGSPKPRAKFLCSHGGKILPRPSDGHLKYVGGETRVISVPRGIPFQELVKKLTYLIDGEMVLKYQVASEDLDALITVKSDEDLRHMLDEIDRYESTGAPRLRAFLFPINTTVMENQTPSVDQRTLEQWYIDAINGIIIRSSPNPIKQHPSINAMQQHCSLASSANSSPRSLDSFTTEAMNNYEGAYHNNFYNNVRTSNMHKVKSSPSICGLNGPQQQSNHYFHPFSPQFAQYPSYHSPKPPIDPQKSIMPERLISVRSVGRADGVRYQLDSLPPHYYSTSRQNRGNGLLHYDECGHFLDKRMAERNGSLATSPVSSSPLGHGGKALDATIRGGDI